MNSTSKYFDQKPMILIVDDDLEDQELVCKAFTKLDFPIDVKSVFNGEELLRYLRSLDNEEHSYPTLILLDLNMPKISGIEALKEIKLDNKLRRIPIIIFTTSSSERDIAQSYDLGASSYIVKPTSFQQLTQTLKTLSQYWFRER